MNRASPVLNQKQGKDLKLFSPLELTRNAHFIIISLHILAHLIYSQSKKLKVCFPFHKNLNYKDKDNEKQLFT